MENLVKLLLLFLILFPTLVKADMWGIDMGFGQGTRPFGGIDFEFNRGLPYLDAAVFVNHDYVQPYLSGGLQFEHINLGLAGAITHSQFSFGPELGYMQNLSSLFYVKVNNSYMGYPGSNFKYGITLGLGLNL